MASRWPFGKFCFKLSHIGISCGLLPQLYRCWVIYSMNYWIIAFTSLLYITSVGTCLSPPQVDGDTVS